MAVAEQKGLPVNFVLLMATGLMLTVGGLFIYLLVLQGVFGKYSWGSDIPTLDRVWELFQEPKPKVAILYSEYTENRLPAGSTWIQDNMITWKKYLNNYNLEFVVLNDKDIETGKHKDYSLLILPGTQSMSDVQYSAIKKYVDDGGSVFATSGTASYSNDGKWRGWEFFSEVFGLKFTREIERDTIVKIHTLRGGLPITANIPTGFPLKVATWDRPIAATVLEPRTTQVSFWYNYRLEDGLVREEVKKTAGIAYGSYGRGRFVWMGFEIISVIGQQEDYILSDRLFSNCVNWLLYRPIAQLKDWPGDYTSAMIFTPTLRENLDRAKNLISVLQSEKIEPTFFIEPNKAEANPALVKELSKYGEIGALVDIGFLTSINDTINKLNDYETQKNQFEIASAKLRSIIGRDITSIYPYFGIFNEMSKKALADASLKYIFTDSLTDRSVPKAIIIGNNTVLSVTKTARDDYEVVRDYGLEEPEFQLYTYKEDVDRVIFEGGLYVLKLHTDYQFTKENVAVVKDLINYVRTKKVWITSTKELYDWWTKKNKLEMRLDNRSDNRIVVTISNPGGSDMNNFSLDIDLQKKVKNISMSAEIIGTKLPKYNYDSGSRILELKIENLKSGESRTYNIDYELING